MHLRYDPGAMQRVSAARDFGRVAVLLGGDSSEREISLLSGTAVLAGLVRRGVDAHAFDPQERPLTRLRRAGGRASATAVPFRRACRPRWSLWSSSRSRRAWRWWSPAHARDSPGC